MSVQTGAGARDQRVIFQRCSVTEDAMGVEVPRWDDLEPAWAKVLYGTGAERREAGALSAAQTATFRVRSTAALRSVTPADRIFHSDGQAWNITSIAKIGRWEIEFTAVVAAG